jgi:hypothetical protein
MVPVTVYTPPVLVPPPPSIVNQSIEKFWLRASRANITRRNENKTLNFMISSALKEIV